MSQTIFSKIQHKGKSIDDCTVEEVFELQQQYPFAGFLYLQLLEKNLDEKDIIKTKHRAALFLNNQNQLSFLLSEKKLQAFEAIEETTEQSHDASVHLREILQKEKQLTAEEINDLPAFEPLHTVDYFASQGIKFLTDDKKDDKFSIQLKSFTEWLKVMKKLPVQNTELSVAEEQKIVKEADQSNQNKEVVTEAMAEVLEKQKKPLQAIEIYEKLSLIYPQKSPYFAAKIEKLKGSL